jgi:phosphonate transport system substrate-binding protein
MAKRPVPDPGSQQLEGGNGMDILIPSNAARAAEGAWAGAFTRLFGVLLTLILSATSALAGTYSIGVAPQFESRRMFAIWQPIIGELEKRTGHQFKLVVPLTVTDFERELEKGSYDFVYANPYHIVRLSQKQAYLPLVRDKLPLRGILVVRKDSPVRNLKELDGKSLAVPSPNAIGASLLIRADLEHFHGIRMKMVNVKTHSSVYLNVLNGLTEAGGGVEKTLGEQDQPVQDALRVIYTTREMPSHPVAAHSRVDQAAREQVRRALLELAATPAGKALLDEVPMKQPVAASIEDYLVMRKWGLEAYWVGEGK